MRTSRTMARLVWYHTPLRLGPAPKNDTPKPASSEARDEETEHEMRRAMAEKKMALELIEA